MHKHSQILTLAASVGFACLAASCRTAKPTASAQSQRTQTHSAMLHVAEWDGWQRNLSCDSLIVFPLPEEFGHKAANTPDSDRAHTAPATLTSWLHDGARDACAECAAPTAMKLYGVHLSASSKKHTITTASTSDSLDASRQSQSGTGKSSKAPGSRLWPLAVASLTLVIATAILFYLRKRKQ